ncbi:unnamed protein product, partial [Effrenium voratum]
MTALWVQALLFGLFSALSLPLGAILGLALAPVSAQVTSRCMAFGSGALVFAVATQLFGESLFRLYASTWGHPGGCGPRCKDLCVNNVLQIFGAMGGALLYLLLNRWLENRNKRSPSESARQATFDGSLELGASMASQLHHGSSMMSMRRMSSILPEDAGVSFLHDAEAAPNVALSMWLGMMLDGIPEALMLGFMTNEGAVTFSFLVAIFIANFPEAFSGASLLSGQKMPVSRRGRA